MGQKKILEQFRNELDLVIEELNSKIRLDLEPQQEVLIIRSIISTLRKNHHQKLDEYFGVDKAFFCDSCKYKEYATAPYHTYKCLINDFEMDEYTPSCELYKMEKNKNDIK